jgi:hypothetical protein
MTDTKDNKQGQGGGPKTVLGKVTCSKNAIKHGITSQQLLNPDEAKNFRLPCKNLSIIITSIIPW